MPVHIGDISLDRMAQAVEDVHQRLLRSTSLLDQARVPYAVVGGNAVAAWVSRVDKAAVRNTQDVDILLRRENLDAAVIALESGGFVHRHAAGIDMFLDGPEAKFRDAVHVLFAGEKVRAEYDLPTPDVDDCDSSATPFRVLNLEALVQMKLTSFRDKDRTHLRDFIDIGLVDTSWPARFTSSLATRLQSLLDDPHG